MGFKPQPAETEAKIPEATIPGMPKLQARKPESARQESLEAEALLSALTEFSARVGHDLLGPVNQAGSLLALFIKRHRSQLDSEADQLLDFLQSASSRTQTVLNGIHKYMEMAGAAPRFRPVDLNVSLDSARAVLARRIAESGAEIVSEPLPLVSADAGQITALFEILIGNSIKFRSADAPLRVRISASSSVDESADATEIIAIADNGIGIDPEHREAVVLPFRRLNGKEYEGPGLGLAIAKLIAERHGGHLAVGETGIGACVQFSLRSV
jgi:light-regulated signal transduction histidine kinase (bacteriophytochrome)